MASTSEEHNTTELDEFAKNKQDVDELNKDLQMFLCLSKINNLGKKI